MKDLFLDASFVAYQVIQNSFKCMQKDFQMAFLMMMN